MVSLYCRMQHVLSTKIKFYTEQHVLPVPNILIVMFPAQIMGSSDHVPYLWHANTFAHSIRHATSYQLKWLRD